VSIKNIENMFFNTYITAKAYLNNEREKGLLKSLKIPGLNKAQVYFLSYKGINHLKTLGIDTTRQKINIRESVHDLIVNDILIWFIKNKGVSYKTDFMLRQERGKVGQQTTIHRIPDLVICDKEGNLELIEYQAADKSKETILSYIEDYQSYYKNHHVYFVVKKSKAEYYNKIFSGQFTGYFICAFDDEAGLEVILKG
jgi:hypothetical protein